MILPTLLAWAMAYAVTGAARTALHFALCTTPPPYEETEEERGDREGLEVDLASLDFLGRLDAYAHHAAKWLPHALTIYGEQMRDGEPVGGAMGGGLLVSSPAFFLALGAGLSLLFNWAA